tara:strand:+ start:45 stop:1919 length:1875 start_codon:yes stop_codon:yes gene_type:complete
MPSYTFTNASGTNYPIAATFNAAIGDTITLTFPTTSNYNHVAETGGAPQLGNAATPATFNHQVVGNYGTSYSLFFFTSDTTNNPSQPYWHSDNINSVGYRGKFVINIISNTCTQATPTGSLSVSIAATASQNTTATLSGSSHGANCNAQSRAILFGSGSFINGLVHSVVRGNPYSYEVRNEGQTGVLSLSTQTVPYLNPDLSISTGGNLTSSDGTWTQTIGSITGTFNEYAIFTNTGSPIVNNAGNLISTGVNGTTLVNDNPSNAPVGTTSYLIFGRRTTSSGGSNNWQSTGTSFSVTRSTTFNESISNPTGTYFDNLTGSGAAHTVTVAGTTAGQYYNVSTSGSNINTPLFSSWTQGNGARVVTDTGATTPAGANSTQTTYHLWRSAASNGGSPTATGDTYTRTLVNYDRFLTPTDTVNLGTGVTSYSLEVGNTISGHVYYVYRGTDLLVSGTATGTTITLTVPETSLSSTGDSATHTLKTQSAFNSAPASEFSTGKSWTVQRTGTASQGSGGTSSTYGMEVFKSDGTTKLYDTTSRTGRIVASGTTGSIASGSSTTITVTSMQNSTSFNVIVVPTVAGSGNNDFNIFSGYTGIVITKSSGSFTIQNTGSVTNSYKYFVVRSG